MAWVPKVKAVAHLAGSTGMMLVSAACGGIIVGTMKLDVTVDMHDTEELKEKVEAMKKRHNTVWKEQEALLLKQEQDITNELKSQGVIIAEIKKLRLQQEAAAKTEQRSC